MILVGWGAGLFAPYTTATGAKLMTSRSNRRIVVSGLMLCGFREGIEQASVSMSSFSLRSETEDSRQSLARTVVREHWVMFRGVRGRLTVVFRASDGQPARPISV